MKRVVILRKLHYQRAAVATCIAQTFNTGQSIAAANTFLIYEQLYDKRTTEFPKPCLIKNRRPMTAQTMFPPLSSSNDPGNVSETRRYKIYFQNRFVWEMLNMNLFKIFGFRCVVCDTAFKF